MGVQSHTYKTYTIDCHPMPDKAIQWMRDNLHDLGNNDVDDALAGLRGFCQHYNIALKECAICIIPVRDECIDVRVEDDDISALSGVRLFKYIQNNFSHYRCKYTNTIRNTLDGNCPFTGEHYDETLLDPIREFMSKPYEITFSDLINKCTRSLHNALHSQGEYIYSNEGLKKTAELNNDAFLEDGRRYH